MASPATVVGGVCGGVEVKGRVGGASAAQDVAGGWAVCKLGHACSSGRREEEEEEEGVKEDVVMDRVLYIQSEVTFSAGE